MMMDYMKRKFAMFVLIAVLLFGMNNGQASSSNDTSQSEDEELRSMLNTVLEQNTRLTLQNKRLQQVWFGMQQMCKALSMPICECGEDQGEQQNIISATTLPSKSSSSVSPPTQFIEMKPASVKMLSVKSGGINEDPTPIVVTYAAIPDHSTFWYGHKRYEGMFRTAGQRVRSNYDPNVYIATINVEDLGNVSFIIFRVNNGNESLGIRLNVTELETKQERDVDTPDVSLLQINTSYVSPRDTDLNIFGFVPLEYNDIDSFAVSFTGVNTSTNPPVMFEFNKFGADLSECLDMVISNHTSTTLILNVTIKYPCVQFGGLMYVTMEYRDIKSTMLIQLLYGPSIKIYSPDDNEIIPSKTMGIYPVPSETVITSSKLSIPCYAIGNPKPNVTVWKIKKDDSQQKMATEAMVSDTYLEGVFMTKQFSRPKQAVAKYICRASNGFETRDAPTEVIVLKPAVFDESKTGVIKNTSESFVISCKAKGKPKPRLELRLYKRYGPDLTKTGMYKVRRYDSNKHSSQVTLTIPANDTDIHQVYCYSRQGEPNMSHDFSRVIDIFPGVDSNWELFDRITQALGQRV